MMSSLFLQVISASLDEPAVVPFLTRQNVDPELLLKLAARCNLPGAESLFVARYNHLMGSSNYIVNPNVLHAL